MQVTINKEELRSMIAKEIDRELERTLLGHYTSHRLPPETPNRRLFSIACRHIPEAWTHGKVVYCPVDAWNRAMLKGAAK